MTITTKTRITSSPARPWKEHAGWPGASKDYPEHYKAGLKPAHVREKYYHARSPQGHNLVNRVVDIGSYIDHKVRTNMANKGKGPAGTAGARLRQQLARQGRKLPMLGNDDETANFAYVKHFLMDDFQLLGPAVRIGVRRGVPVYRPGTGLRREHREVCR